MAIHVLLVDDEPVLLSALVPHVERLPGSICSVDCANTPAEALARLAAYPPEARVLVLSDFNLNAGKTGVQLLQDVARVRPDALRVLMSGYEMRQLGVKTDGAPLHGFVEKPLYLHTMVPQLSDIMAQHWR